MELQVLEKGFDYARKRKKWVFILGAVGFASYGAYRLYHAPIVARKRMRVSKLLGALISVAEAVSESAETVGVVSGDLKDFLQSDSNELPNSLKQISKIARSQHFADSLATATRSVTEGVLRGYGTVNPSNADQTGSASLLADRVLNKMLTPSGSGFASVVVGSFARNLVLGFYSGGAGLNSRNENGVSGADGSSSNGVQVPNWVDVVCDEKCAELIGNCVQIFVSTAVAVYLDKTMHINTYDDFFSGLTNPNHETKVKNMLVTVCNNAMETLIKTSHQVLRNPNPSFREDTSVTPSRIEALGVETSFVESKPESDSDDENENENESSWISRVSSALAVPSNRKLVLDVTGTVTFETVRSVMEFLLQTFVESIRTCVDVVREAMLEIVRYAASKSSVIVTTCLSLCLHIIQPVALGL